VRWIIQHLTTVGDTDKNRGNEMIEGGRYSKKKKEKWGRGCDLRENCPNYSWYFLSNSKERGRKSLGGGGGRG